MEWGLSVSAVRELLRKREWQNWSRLRNRMLGKHALPIKIPLKPPTGNQALADIKRFHQYIKEWQNWQPETEVIWEQKQYRKIGSHQVPVAVVLPTLQSLFYALGTEVIRQTNRWHRVLSRFIIDVDQKLSETIIRNLPELDQCRDDDIESLLNLLPQLKAGMGTGCYLRALPVTGVDTKFIEQHETFIRQCLQAIHPENDVSDLLNWLGCREKPKGWLTVRPLCPKTRQWMMGLPVLKLSGDILRETPLPGSHIIVVENEETGFALPELPETVAIFGGGKNISWMDAPWLSQKHLAYWGDIDTWGLSILSDARQLSPDLKPLMMDKATLLAFAGRMSQEKSSVQKMPLNLVDQETDLYSLLLEKGSKGENNRLEQERLSQDFIQEKLQAWRHG